MTHFYLEQEIACLSINPKYSRQIIIGQLDGVFTMYEMKLKNLNSLGSFKVSGDGYVRDVSYMGDGKRFALTTSDCSLGFMDTVTIKPYHWIKNATDNKPSALLTLGGDKGIQVVVGDDEGHIKMFDFRTKEEAILEFKDQEESITDLKYNQGNVLATSSDGFLCTYDLRKKKLSVKSEQAESEYNSICISNDRTYIATGNGILDVYKNGEYGYILERMDTKMKYGIDSIVEVRDNLLMCSSMLEDYVKFINIQPNKVLKKKPVPFPIGKMVIDGNKKFFIGYGMCENFYHCSIAEMINDIPFITRDNVKNTKKLIKKDKANGFFNDLVNDT